MIKEEKVDSITFITIQNNNLEIVLSCLGASIFAIYYKDTLMTLSLKNKKDYFNPDLYHGKTIGPVCGRIAEGNINKYSYDLNEDNVTRHGGNNGLSTQIFDYEYFENSDDVSVIFHLNGFIVTYELMQNDDSFIVKYDYAGEAQPVALTNHTFFHLGGNFEQLKLKVISDYFVENDPKTLVPLNKHHLIPCLDFNNEEYVYKNINDSYLMDSRTKGYDHYLHFKNERSLQLSNAKYSLHIATDFDGVLIYSDNYDFNEITIDHRLGIRKALAVEPQDSPLERKIYDKENNYHRFIKYCFKKI